MTDNQKRRRRGDLTERVSRYRAQLVAEGRLNSVKMLDNALAQSRKKEEPDSDEQ